MKTFSNPILPGFYPDPSICRVDEDYYMVTSSFTYFPGVPIFHSKDLVHWNQIGHVLDRESQIPLHNGDHSSGIFAPTIRYYEGVFYMITTNVRNGGNFIVTTRDPAGSWSEPYYLDAEGIDPSLFFENGRCFYCGAKDRTEGIRYDGDNEIFIRELDLNSMKLIGESYPAWYGALKNNIWAEGPHIYKIKDWYYLLISEGGTGHEHAVTIARSKSLFEPFEGYMSNPILTHRHLGKDYPIVNVGHTDIVETQNGEWWMVALASRPYGGYFRNLGRETFLVPLCWEDGWPVVNLGIGKVQLEERLPNLATFSCKKNVELDEFSDKEIPLHFIYTRNPIMKDYSLSDRDSYLRLYLSEHQLNKTTSPTLLCRRQQSKSYIAETKMEFNPIEGESAGLVLFQSNLFYYTLAITCKNNLLGVEIIKCENGIESSLEFMEINVSSSEYILKVEAVEQALEFSITYDEETIVIGSNLDGRILSTDIAGGFVGTCIGMFATKSKDSQKEIETRRSADFDWFKLINND